MCIAYQAYYKLAPPWVTNLFTKHVTKYNLRDNLTFDLTHSSFLLERTQWFFHSLSQQNMECSTCKDQVIIFPCIFQSKYCKTLEIYWWNIFWNQFHCYIQEQWWLYLLLEAASGVYSASIMMQMRQEVIGSLRESSAIGSRRSIKVIKYSKTSQLK